MKIIQHVMAVVLKMMTMNTVMVMVMMTMMISMSNGFVANRLPNFITF